MSLLLANGQLVNLGMNDGTNDLAVLGDLGDLSLTLLLTVLSAEAGDVLSEGLALLVEALVEAALQGVGQVLSPDGGKGAQATRSLDVADNSDDDNWRCLEDGDGLHNLLLVGLGPSSVQLADNVSHASLETEESSQVHRLALKQHA